MNLQQLHDTLLSEGCNRFYIDGIGGPQSDDVERLGYMNGSWEVYYIERGQKGQVLYSCTDEDEAIKYYYNYIKSFEHRHLVAFTRSEKIANYYKNELHKLGLRTVQNDIPVYSVAGDRVYRIFVINKDIFKAKESFPDIPYFDEDLKR